MNQQEAVAIITEMVRDPSTIPDGYGPMVGKYKELVGRRQQAESIMNQARALVKQREDEYQRALGAEGALFDVLLEAASRTK